MRAWLLGIGFLLCGSASACLNDRDVLESQITGHQDLKDAVSGWFVRFPAKYYQVRIDRLLGKSKSSGLNAFEYNDIAVAYDRIGDDDSAIKWISEKDGLLKKGKLKTLGMDWGTGPEELKGYGLSFDQYQSYSTEANWGTFLVHRWIRAGLPLNRINEAEESVRRIVHAIDINPNAHAGREWAQRDFIRWIIKEREKPGKDPPEFEVSGKPLEAGLAGLVELGGAWESVDLFNVLSHEATSKDGRYLAYLRAQELAAAGKKSLVGMKVQPVEDEFSPEERKHIEEGFQFYRSRADAREEEFSKFVLAQIGRGLHPDTTGKAFWDGYTAPSRPVLKIAGPLPYVMFFIVDILPVFVLLSPFLVALWWIRKLRREFKKTRGS